VQRHTFCTISQEMLDEKTLACYCFHNTSIGVAWISRDKQREKSLFSLCVVNSDNCEILNYKSYTTLSARLESIKIAFDAVRNAWVITTLEIDNFPRTSRIVLYVIHSDTLKLIESPIVFEDTSGIQGIIGPILEVSIYEQIYYILYMKSLLDEVDSPLVQLGHMPLTNSLQCSIEEVTVAERAIGKMEGKYCYLLACRPEFGEFSESVPFEGSTAEWRFSFTSWINDESSDEWKYTPQQGIPVASRAVPDVDFDWLRTDADIIVDTFPGNSKRKHVAGMIMIDSFDYKSHNYTMEEESKLVKRIESLISIDSGGTVVETCSDSIGVQLQLYALADGIIGTDIVDEIRRIWKWSFGETHFSRILRLDQNVQQVSIAISQAETRQIWLIEDFGNYIKVSRRDSLTLNEISSPMILENMHLLIKEGNWRSFECNKPLDSLSYKDGLLLLLLNEKNSLTFHKVII